jgi:hypothetical protein
MSRFHVSDGGPLAGLIAWLFLASALAAAPVIDETIAPAQISIGESAELRIKSSGTEMQTPKLPVVPGLEFRIVEQLQGAELVHGASIATMITVVRVTPQIAGTFVIPESAPRSQPLILRVNPANFGGGSPIARPGIPSETAGKDTLMTEDGSAFIRLSIERREVYVGESVPIAIELGLRAGVVSSLNGLPTLAGNDFTLNNLSRPPDRKETVIDGSPFILLTWRTVLAPVKPGDFSLIVEVPLTVRVSTRPRREALLEDQLGDPFMQHRFGTTVPKDIKALSPPLVLAVSALPSDGRPPEFSGAVGTFKISSDISSPAASAGDPLTLRMHVTGSGNFDRVDSAMLEHVENWKTYPPTSSFKASDAIGFKGEKVFEQPVVASTPGAQMLPAMTFAYFDPATGRYESLRTSPLSITISPSAADSTPSAGQAAAGTGASQISWTGLRPDHTAPGAWASSLLPLYLQPRFLAIPSLLTLMFAGAWYRLRGRADPGYRASLRDRSLSKAAQRALSQMEEAARAGNGARFFTLARRTLRETLAARWQTAPEQITTAEVDARLERDSDGDEIRRLFALADEADYAGQLLHETDLTRWTEIVRRQIPERAP